MSDQNLVKKQTTALFLGAIGMMGGAAVAAMNIHWIMGHSIPLVAFLITQIPSALGGFYLGYTLMTAGRREGLNRD
jgi:hypothetical protein